VKRTQPTATPGPHQNPLPHKNALSKFGGHWKTTPLPNSRHLKYTKNSTYPLYRNNTPNARPQTKGRQTTNPTTSLWHKPVQSKEDEATNRKHLPQQSNEKYNVQ